MPRARRLIRALHTTRLTVHPFHARIARHTPEPLVALTSLFSTPPLPAAIPVCDTLLLALGALPSVHARVACIAREALLAFTAPVLHAPPTTRASPLPLTLRLALHPVRSSRA
eukprot:22481-Rhodomonas_salina.1